MVERMKPGDLVVWHAGLWHVNQPCRVGLIVKTLRWGSTAGTTDASVLWSDGTLDLTWVGNLRLVKGMKASG